MLINTTTEMGDAEEAKKFLRTDHNNNNDNFKNSKK